MFLENNCILITNKFHGEHNLYYDINNDIFLQKRVKTPSGVYILTVLAMAATRSLKYRPIEGNYIFLLLLSVSLGILSVYSIRTIEKFFNSSESFKKVELSESEIDECVKNGKKLLSNQLKFLVVICIFLLFICISFYFNRTWLYFLGIAVASMLATILAVFSNYVNKNRAFLIIEKNRY